MAVDKPIRRITVAAVGRRLARYAQRARGGTIQLLEEGPQFLSRKAPLDFSTWLKKEEGRRPAGFPDAWHVTPQLSFDEHARIAVVMHCHFADLVPELLTYLRNIPTTFDLFVTNSSGEPLHLDTSGLENLGHAAVVDVDNRGRDIFPLVQLVNFGALDPYEIVLKVHTKKSAWREQHSDLAGDGTSWKDSFLEALLGSRETVERILSAFATDSQLGQVTAPGNVLGPEFWGADRALTRELLRRMEMDIATNDLRFCAGSMYWCRAFVLQGLRALSMTEEDFDPEPAAIDGTTAHAVERSIGILAREAGLALVEANTIVAGGAAWTRYAPTASRVPRVRFIPFYLAQFHPIPENDRWWGKGFTEWTNVTAARPVYDGHYQPRLPGEFGFYDLRLDEIRDQQGALAAEHGIEGFMYYYYWFSGKRLLSRPIESMLRSSVPTPFCIMWANENWTRRWDGRSRDVLVGQDYERVPAETFIDDVLEFLRDDRYIRVDGRPVLAVYRPAQMGNFAEVAEAWRAKARAAGIGEILLLSVDVAEEFGGLGEGLADSGLDGRLGFPPHNLPWKPGPSHRLNLHPQFRGNIMSYAAMVDDASLKLASVEHGSYPGVMVNFDNTARRQWHPDIWYGSNPYSFRRWLANAALAVSDRDRAERVVFINAWNEWAEGTVLEPTGRQGRTYLQAVKDVAFG